MAKSKDKNNKKNDRGDSSNKSPGMTNNKADSNQNQKVNDPQENSTKQQFK